MDSGKFIDGLRRRGFYQLGSGMYSTVFAKPGSDRVIKVCTTMDDWPAYIMWSSKAGYAGGLAPKVYSLKVHNGWYVAVMERLNCTIAEVGYHSDVKKEFHALSSAMYGYGRPEEHTLSPHHAEFAKTFTAAGLGRPDLHSQNFMTRFDGTLVCTDPLGSSTMAWLANSGRRQRTHDLNP